MSRNFYSTAFRNSNGTIEASRIFSTKAAAQKWVKWLASQAYVIEVFLYCGEPGGERL